ncbi:Ankyrin-2 [Dactylellina cionopaga]|nr:Ankyrin-2 [Dactylellina cionopaga]
MASSDSSTAEFPNSIFLAAKDGNVDDIIHFVSQGQSPNGAGCGGYTPLHIACVFGHTSAVQTLLLHGADPEQKTEDGKTALNIAEDKGFTEIVEHIKSEEWKKDRADYVKP